MRIKTVRLAWFRGAADPVEIEPNGKSMVVYGQNGTGKSSFVDAVEYVVHSGKLAHLTHEYSGRHQEKAIRNTHTPAGRRTEFWIKFMDDTELCVKIEPDGSYTSAGAEAVDMGAWDYRRTVLRQDEVAEFIRSRKGEKYSALLPLFGLHDLELAAENLRQLSRVVHQQSQLAQKQGALAQMVIGRKRIFAEKPDAAIEANIVALHERYCLKSKTTEMSARCQELEVALNQRINELSTETRRYGALRVVADLKLAESVKAVREANARLAQSMEPLIAEKLEMLRSAEVFVAKVGDVVEVDCPACGRSIPADRLKAHVKAEHERLEDIIAVFEDRRAGISALIDDLKAMRVTLSKAEMKEWREKEQGGALRSNVEWADRYSAEGLRQLLAEDDLRAIENNCLPLIEAADKASEVAPPEVRGLSADKTVLEAARAVFEANPLAEEIARIDGLVRFIGSLETGIRGAYIPHLSEGVPVDYPTLGVGGSGDYL